MILSREQLAAWALASRDQTRPKLCTVCVKPDRTTYATDGAFGVKLTLDPDSMEFPDDVPTLAGTSEPATDVLIPRLVARRAFASLYRPVAKKKRKALWTSYALLRVNETHGFIVTAQDDDGDYRYTTYAFRQMPGPYVDFDSVIPSRHGDRDGVKEISFDPQRLAEVGDYLGRAGCYKCARAELVDSHTAATFTWNFDGGRGLLLLMPTRL